MRRGRLLRTGKGEDAPTAVCLHGMTELDWLAISEADDRRGMQAHADGQTRGQMLPGRFAGKDRGTVARRRSRGVAAVPDEIALCFLRIEVLVRPRFCGRAEHPGP